MRPAQPIRREVCHGEAIMILLTAMVLVVIRWGVGSMVRERLSGDKCGNFRVPSLLTSLGFWSGVEGHVRVARTTALKQ